MDETEDAKRFSPEMERAAAQRARDRANASRWDLNVAIFLFAVLILVIILITYVEMVVEVVALIAIFGLGMVWLVGWRQGKQLYPRFYDEELLKLARETTKVVKEEVEETLEEKIQKALRDRWR